MVADTILDPVTTKIRPISLTLPNLITLARLLSVPIIVFLVMTNQMVLAFYLFLLAGISDGIDGALAKYCNMASRLGAYLDPLADKALLTSIYVALAAKGLLPLWLAVLVVSRDILIIGAVILSWVMAHPVKVAPLMVSKAATTAQICLAVLILAMVGLGLSLGKMIDVMVYLAAILTALSAMAYMKTWFEHMSAHNGADAVDE